MRSTNEPECSGKIRDRVIRARGKQLERFASSREKIYCNAQMSSRHIRTFCELSADCERLLERAMTQQGLSARAHDRILKVARTIADIEEMLLSSPSISPKLSNTGRWTALTGPKIRYGSVEGFYHEGHEVPRRKASSRSQVFDFHASTTYYILTGKPPA